MGLIVKWSCGCIGIDPDLVSIREKDKQLYCMLDHCDRGLDDSGELFIGWRSMEKKTFKSLPEEETIALLEKLGTLVHDGYNLRRIKSILKEERR